ncbi:MAG: methyltransferase domain-containing protein, partial [Planctomycetaceae bacterium]|nr:methyltransferase domain-containing protein [Planctomycetaceae bacterium]
MTDHPPDTGVEFNKAYKTFHHLLWTDRRIPKQLKTLVQTANPSSSLELGCGLGYFSEYVAKQGVKATSVDFSSVAIEKAKKRTAKNKRQPAYLVGDVTNLPLEDNQY